MPDGREVATLVEDRGVVSWRKSSHSNTTEANCCEVALLGIEVRVRDSYRQGGDVLTFTPMAWRAAMALFQGPGLYGGGP